MNVRTIALTVVLCAIAVATSTHAQPPSPSRSDTHAGLLGLVPVEAFLVVERRGHTAVRDAFQASNLGQFARDEAIGRFIHDSRDRIERMIVTEMFDLADFEAIEQRRQWLHEVCKAFWCEPSAGFLTLGESFDEAPGVGLMCLTGRRRAACRKALEGLMKSGLASASQGGFAQTFEQTIGGIRWQGRAGDDEAFTLPTDPNELATALENRTQFLVHWEGDLLCVCFNAHGAEAISKVLAGEGGSLEQRPSLKSVWAKTAMTDWEFRWHVDVHRLVKALRDTQEYARYTDAMLKIWGLNRLRSVGGTEGYADKVYTRLTYLDAPDGGASPWRLRGGQCRRR